MICNFVVVMTEGINCKKNKKNEACIYTFQALNNSYHVEIMEPDTPWKFKAKECAK